MLDPRPHRRLQKPRRRLLEAAGRDRVPPPLPKLVVRPGAPPLRARPEGPRRGHGDGRRRGHGGVAVPHHAGGRQRPVRHGPRRAHRGDDGPRRASVASAVPEPGTRRRGRGRGARQAEPRLLRRRREALRGRQGGTVPCCARPVRRSGRDGRAARQAGRGRGSRKLRVRRPGGGTAGPPLVTVVRPAPRGGRPRPDSRRRVDALRHGGLGRRRRRGRGSRRAGPAPGDRGEAGGGAQEAAGHEPGRHARDAR
mmetsp:Transcript_4204/g.9428  ORF Transcript_4204/g.9428 Transcript_4204/m.9428 type:complete len:253 (+) Transcript_4204:475-1233(+)